MTALRRWWPWLALVLVLLLVGVLPYYSLVDHVPWGPDAAKWVDRGTLDDPNWSRWVFDSKHFIGYRPVPALSFVLNELFTGYEPWGYRLTDLHSLIVDLAQLLHVVIEFLESGFLFTTTSFERLNLINLRSSPCILTVPQIFF